MAQRRARGLFVDAPVFEGFPERSLHTAPGHRGGSGRQRDATTARCREDQDGMTRRDPILAQPFPRPLGHGDIPSFPTLPVADVDQQASAVEIAHLELGAFLQAQPTGGGRGEAHAVAGPSHAGETPLARLAAEEHRQLFLAWRTHQAQGGPIALERMVEEELETAQGEGPGTARGVRDVLAREDVVAECFLGDAVGGLVLRLRQLADSPDIPLLGPGGQASELPVFDQPLASWGDGDPSCT